MSTSDQERLRASLAGKLFDSDRTWDVLAAFSPKHDSVSPMDTGEELTPSTGGEGDGNKS